MKYSVAIGTKLEWCDTKAKALRRAAAVTKYYEGVIKVYDEKGQFIKSFDGRK